MSHNINFREHDLQIGLRTYIFCGPETGFLEGLIQSSRKEIRMSCAELFLERYRELYTTHSLVFKIWRYYNIDKNNYKIFNFTRISVIISART